MRLTVFSDYTLRVLIYLGMRNDRLCTIAEIADAYAISRNHLMKVVHHLGLRGDIETVRGKGGGIRLARDPAAINVGAIVRATEQDAPLVECFDIGTSSCRIEAACLLKGVFGKAAQAFYAVLDQYTLADLLKTEQRMADLLEAEKAPRTAGSGEPPLS